METEDRTNAVKTRSYTRMATLPKAYSLAELLLIILAYILMFRKRNFMRLKLP